MVQPDPNVVQAMVSREGKNGFAASGDHLFCGYVECSESSVMNSKTLN